MNVAHHRPGPRFFDRASADASFPAPIAREMTPEELCAVGRAPSAPTHLNPQSMVYGVAWFVPEWPAPIPVDECMCVLVVSCLGRVVGDYHLPHHPSSRN